MQLGESSLDEAVFGGRSLGKDRVARQWSWPVGEVGQEKLGNWRSLSGRVH